MVRILYKALGSSDRTAKGILDQILEYTKKNNREDTILDATALYNRLHPLKGTLKAMDVKGHKIASYLDNNRGIIIDPSKLDPRSRTAYS